MQADVVYGSRYTNGLFGSKYAQQSWPAYLGGRSLSIAALMCTGRYLTDTVTALKLFPRTAAQRARPADDRVRARPRDHVEGARARMPHRRGADSVFPAEQRRGKEDRRQGLGQGVADVLAISSGMNADPCAEQPAIAALLDFRRNETVGARDRQRNKPFAFLRRHGYPFGDARHELELLRPAWRRQTSRRSAVLRCERPAGYRSRLPSASPSSSARVSRPLTQKPSVSGYA